VLVDAFAKGFALGLSLAAPPGPVNAAIASRSLSSWALGASLGFGALTSDMVYLAAVALGGRLAPPWLLPAVGLAGSLLLAYLAAGAARAAAAELRGARGSVPKAQLGGSASLAKSYATGLAMGLTNPFQAGWWATVGLALVAELGAPLAAGFVCGIASWVLGFSFAVSRGRESRKFRAAVYAASSAALAAFALYLALSSAAKLAAFF